jgi:glycosyltransferase involved in cell wall biosynthesis
MPEGTVRPTVTFDMTFPNHNRGGSGNYARQLLAALRERPDLDVGTIEAPANGFPNTIRWLLRGAARSLQSGPASLLHCPAFVAPWALPLPFVVTIHDTLMRRYAEDQPLEWRVYERRVLPGRARAAARVITGTETSRRDLIRDYGVDAARVAVTPYGVDRRFFEVGPKAVSPPGSAPTLLFPGAPIRRKNLGLVLAVMAGAPAGSALSRAVLEISGARAAEFPTHHSEIRALGLDGRVRWLGTLPTEELACAYARADLVVYPSSAEGFGFPPLEAMAVGTPVVASNLSCLPEVCGEAALLVDPSDGRALGEALSAALDNFELRNRLVEAGRRRVAAFTWQRCAEQTLAVYRDVVEG